MLAFDDAAALAHAFALGAADGAAAPLVRLGEPAAAAPESARTLWGALRRRLPRTIFRRDRETARE